MLKQVFTAFTVHLLTLVYGIGAGWIAPNMILFQAEDSPVGILDASEIALIVSLMCVGGVIGTPLFGLLGERIGRKWTILCIALPQILANVLLSLGTEVSYVYWARVLFGLAGGGVFTVIPIFVAEISHESIRGALGTLLSLNWMFGIVMGYVLASWLDYHLVPLVAVAICILFLAIFIWLPESPDFLEHQNKPEKAEKSYAFYGIKRENSLARELKPQLPISIRDFRDVAVRRGILIAWTLIFFADTCGIFTVTNYMTELLYWARIDMDIYVATVAMGLLQIVGCLCSTFLMDRCGRRILFMGSAVGSSVSMFVFGFYYFLLDRPGYEDLVQDLQSWLPVTALGSGIVFASLAIAAAPFFLIAELLPVRLRGFVTSTALTCSWVVAFVVIHSFHWMVEVLGVHGSYWVYASVAMLEVFYVYFCLPETKNLSFDEIQRKLRERRL